MRLLSRLDLTTMDSIFQSQQRICLLQLNDNGNKFAIGGRGVIVRKGRVRPYEQFYQYMMNKFHKTTYSRQSNFNAVSSSHGRRNPLYDQTAQGWGHSNMAEMPQGRKIEIESALLFSSKPFKKEPSKPNDLHPRHPVNKSEAKFYETSVAFTRDRPQSKQQPRPKPKGEGKLKTDVNHPDRPQTSKGARGFRGPERRQRTTTENDEQFPVAVRVSERPVPNEESGQSRNGGPGQSWNERSGQSRRSTKPSSVMAFETSIDPQFLSLFAN